jgi:hypothetical protein
MLFCSRDGFFLWLYLARPKSVSVVQTKIKIVCSEFKNSHCNDFAMWHFRVHIRWIRGVKSNMVENMVGNMVGNMVCFRAPKLPKHGTKHGWLVSHKNRPVAGEAFHNSCSSALAPADDVLTEPLWNAMEVAPRVVDILGATAASLGVLVVPRTTHLGADTRTATRVAQKEIP